MTALVKEYEVASSNALIAQVQAWEKKAANGCKSCVAKLDTLSAKLVPAKAKAPAKAAG